MAIDALVRTARAVDDGRPPDAVVESSSDSGNRPGSIKTAAACRLATPGLLTVVGGVPLVVALAVVRQPRWYPLLDLAQIELQMRGIGTSSPPLLGPYGRFEAFGTQGHHPGPLGFYALWPIYKVMGSTSWALLVSNAVLSLTALGTSLWITRRRAGVLVAAGMAAALAVLVSAHGPTKLILPWNPFLAMLWWVVFLLAVWSLLAGDLVLLPVAVVAGSLCAQNHVGYLGLVSGMALLAVTVLLVRVFNGRRDRGTRVRLASWGVPSAGLLLLLWLPPLYQQLTSAPGNLGVLFESLRSPTMEPVGFGRDGVGLWLRYLDPVAFVRGAHAFSTGDQLGSPWVGAVVLCVWLVAAVAALRLRSVAPQLACLHLVVGVALFLGFLSTAMLSGPPWHYLLLWAWGTLAVLLVATCWSALCAVAAFRASSLSYPGALSDGGGVARKLVLFPLVAVVAGFGAHTTYRSLEIEDLEGTEADAATLAELAPLTVDALSSASAPGGGTEGRYTLRWEVTAHATPAAGMGLLLELERQGFEVGAPHLFGSGDHWVLAEEDATAVVHYVVGHDHIDDWRATPGAYEVGYFDHRSPEEIAEYSRHEADALAHLAAAGRHDLVSQLSKNVLLVAMDEDLPPEAEEPIQELLELGLPAAVFVTPPGLTPSM